MAVVWIELWWNLSHSFIKYGLKVDLVLDSTGLIHLWDWSPQVRIVNLNSGRNPLKRLSNLVGLPTAGKTHIL